MATYAATQRLTQRVGPGFKTVASGGTSMISSLSNALQASHDRRREAFEMAWAHHHNTQQSSLNQLEMDARTQAMKQSDELHQINLEHARLGLDHAHQTHAGAVAADLAENRARVARSDDDVSVLGQTHDSRVDQANAANYAAAAAHQASTAQSLLAQAEAVSGLSIHHATAAEHLAARQAELEAIRTGHLNAAAGYQAGVASAVLHQHQAERQDALEQAVHGPSVDAEVASVQAKTADLGRAQEVASVTHPFNSLTAQAASATKAVKAVQGLSKVMGGGASSAPSTQAPSTPTAAPTTTGAPPSSTQAPRQITCGSCGQAGHTRRSASCPSKGQP